MSHFIKCDRCGTQDSVMGTVSLPPGWQKVINHDLCEPCCQMVRDFIRFKPSDAAALPVEPIPEEVKDLAPLEPAKDKLFETAPETPAASIAEEVAKVVNSGALDTPTCKVTMTANLSDEQNADERGRTQKSKRRKLAGQDAILPDPRKPIAPPTPGAQA